ncbi:hypothetical protein GOV11_03045 [Candidatus Woesearchaeota archaeon]|nr:hypothetical protein [Candidatus Woesearchaeota archaeon]
MTGHNHLQLRLEGSVRKALIGAIALIILLGTIFSAVGLSADVPSSVNEGDDYVVSMSGTGALYIYEDGSFLVGGAGQISTTVQTDSTSAGLVEYTFSSSIEGNETRYVQVEDVPLEITVLNPTSSELTIDTVTYKLDTNWQPDLCWVTVDGDSHTLTPQPDGTQEETLPITEGVHTISYKCKLGTEIAQQTTTVLVDTKSPDVTAFSPVGEVTGPHITLQADTAEIARCKYSEEDLPYDDQTGLMSTVFALRNSVILELHEERSFTYYIRCQDVHGNTNTVSEIVSFSTKLAPSASIDLDDDEPLKAGTYEISLETSILLAETPTLSYRFQDSGQARTIGLDGENNAWTGYITIPDGTNGNVISFVFEGKSLRGVKGTEITEGAIILFDAIPPEPISAITARNASGGIELTWFHEDEDLVFNIYRSDEEGVGQENYYATSGGNTYLDLEAGDARYQYYKIAAVDKAGNIGPLSHEVWASYVDIQLDEDLPVNPITEAKIDHAIISLKAALIDANTTIKSLEEEQISDKVAIIEVLDLVGKAKQARLNLEAVQRDLKELRGRSVTQDQADSAVQSANNAIADARKELITRIMPQAQTQIVQESDLQSLERNLPYAMIGTALEGAERDDYLSRAITLQDRITITLNAKSYTLWSKANEEIPGTYIEKQIRLDNPENDITIVEVIPKDIAKSVSELKFDKPPVILEDDPVVQYSYDILERAKYAYVVDRIVSLDKVKMTRTIAYPKISEPVASQPNKITGQATTGLRGIFSWDTLLIILAVIIIGGLLVYYVALETTNQPFKGIPNNFAKPKPAQTAPRSVAPRPAAPRVVAPPVRKIITRPVAQPLTAVAPPANAKDVLAEAEKEIDEKLYDNALELYKKAISQLERDEGLKRILHEQTIRVYIKLKLFKAMADAHKAIDERDVIDARAALRETKELASKLGEAQTTLMQEAKHSYTELVKEFNRLEIERTEIY